MLPACELSSGTSPHAARPTSTDSNTVRIDGSGRWSPSGKSATAPSSEYAPGSPWYATTATARAYGSLRADSAARQGSHHAAECHDGGVERLPPLTPARVGGLDME